MSSIAEAATLENVACMTRDVNACRQQMPLTFLKGGERATVLKVRGKGEVHYHLENLGFVPGASIKVISEQAGNLIVEVKGAQVALGKTAASKIITY